MYDCYVPTNLSSCWSSSIIRIASCGAAYRAKEPGNKDLDKKDKFYFKNIHLFRAYKIMSMDHIKAY